MGNVQIQIGGIPLFARAPTVTIIIFYREKDEIYMNRLIDMRISPIVEFQAWK